ncbi:hypothetical protein D3C85_1850860 [compost metagenome]
MNRLRTALTAEMGSIRLPMVKDVPATVNFGHTSVVVPSIKHRLVRRLVGVNMKVIIADNNPPVDEACGRGMAGGIA